MVCGDCYGLQIVLVIAGDTGLHQTILAGLMASKIAHVLRSASMEGSYNVRPPSYKLVYKPQ
jgi:hypothetical protein